MSFGLVWRDSADHHFISIVVPLGEFHDFSIDSDQFFTHFTLRWELVKKELGGAWGGPLFRLRMNQRSWIIKDKL